jgi:hypothetical protein
MNGASSALCNAAPELGPGQPEVVAEYPKEWGVDIDIDLAPLAVDSE